MNARLRYVTDSVETASPARLLVQLYDRLVLDLNRGEQAMAAGRPWTAEAPVPDVPAGMDPLADAAAGGEA